jgi:hypothetical protein
VYGIGKKKCAEYGEAWLKIIATFEADQKLLEDKIAPTPKDDGPNGGEDLYPTPENRGPKPREMVQEAMDPSFRPPTLSTGMSIQFGETTLSGQCPTTLQTEDKDGSNKAPAFGSPMDCQPSSALKRKREISSVSDPDGEQSPSRRLAFTPARSFEFTPTATPFSVASQQLCQIPSKHLDQEKSVLHNKLEAYINSVVSAMPHKPYH